MRYPFIEGHRNDYPVTLLCRVMQVARSGYYTWRKEPLSTRKVADMVLLQHIRDIFEEGRQTYGSGRIQGILADHGLCCGRERIARLMQADGLKPKTRRPFRVITTDSKHQLPVAANHLDQDFTPDGPDQKWATDMTYIPTAEGWLYLAVVLDLYSRRIVGWAMSDSLNSSWSLTPCRWRWQFADRHRAYCIIPIGAATTTRACSKSMIRILDNKL